MERGHMDRQPPDPAATDSDRARAEALGSV